MEECSFTVGHFGYLKKYCFQQIRLKKSFEIIHVNIHSCNGNFAIKLLQKYDKVLLMV